ncbi:MAG: class I SAM-dependent methyltransferase [bacterium]
MTNEVQNDLPRNCPLCGANRLDRVVRFKTGQTVFFCTRCHNGHIWPPPHFTTSDYAAGHANNAGIFAREETRRRGYANHFCNFIRKCHTLAGTRVLEIGCGAGYLLDAMASEGARVEGIEIDHDTRQLCINRGLIVHNADVTDWAKTHEGRYDLVVMCHVLEHMQDAKTCLSNCMLLLAPLGRLCVAQPLHTAFVPRVMGRRWQAWAPEQHYWHFTPRGLSQLLTDQHFTVDAVTFSHPDYRYPSIRDVVRPKFFIACLTQAVAASFSWLIASHDQFYLSAHKQSN